MRLLLGAKHDEPALALRAIRLPCFASFKFDGWRGLWQGLEFFTRNGKTIPNRVLRAYASSFLANCEGWDGEIIVGEPTAPDVFRKTDKFCKRQTDRLPADGVRFFVFDNAFHSGSFRNRINSLHAAAPFVEVVEHFFIDHYDDLEAFEASAVALGYEGICTRSPDGPYKQGRSTMREQYLVKVKRYIDEEVKIIGFEEQRHNANPAFVSETGYTKRSTHQEGKIPVGVLGALVVDWRGSQLRVGTGFSSEDRRQIWNARDDYLGKVGTIRFSPPTKDLPRQPVWKGLRHDL